MLLTVPPRLLRNSILKRTLLHLSKRSLTRSTTQRGTALLAVTLALMLRTRLATSSISISDKSQSCCSRAVRSLYYFRYFLLQQTHYQVQFCRCPCWFSLGWTHSQFQIAVSRDECEPAWPTTELLNCIYGACDPLV